MRGKFFPGLVFLINASYIWIDNSFLTLGIFSDDSFGNIFYVFKGGTSSFADYCFFCHIYVGVSTATSCSYFFILVWLYQLIYLVFNHRYALLSWSIISMTFSPVFYLTYYLLCFQFQHFRLVFLQYFSLLNCSSYLVSSSSFHSSVCVFD